MLRNSLWLFALVAGISCVSCGEKKPDGTGKTSGTETSGNGGNILTITPVPRIVRDDGAFELVSIIEGVNANKRFASELKVIENQRAELDRLRKHIDAPPADVSVTRDEEITRVGKTLGDSLAKMKRVYGYNANSHHILIPYEAELLEVVGSQGRTEKVHDIVSPENYERLQNLRAIYEKHAKAGEPGKSDASKTALQLQNEFSFNVKSSYTLNIRRSALYCRIH